MKSLDPLITQMRLTNHTNSPYNNININDFVLFREMEALEKYLLAWSWVDETLYSYTSCFIFLQRVSRQ